MAYESSLPVQIRGRRRVKEGVVRDGCGALRAGQGNLPEAGKTVRLGSSPGPAGGREYKSPIVLGLLSRGPRQAGVSKGVCACVLV